ncbi:ORF6N domain-containing protein [Massilia antarctica]|nr:ORF6N domain-containing protein [Massilia antarctica]
MSGRPPSDLLADAAGRQVTMQSLKVRAAALPRIQWNGQTVITTELLAQLYETEAKHIQQNFARNSLRFNSGLHYYKVSGRALKDLRPSLRGLQISAKTRSLILWTDRGATRHAKMIETDRAWDAFSALEDHYFKQFDVDPDLEPATADDKEILHVAAYRLSVRNKVPISTGHTIHNEAAGTKHYSELTKGGVKQAVQASAPLIERTATEEHFAKIQARKNAVTGPTSQLALPLHDPPGQVS